MATIKDLAGQTAVYGFSNIIGRLLNYLLVPLHTYIFPPEQYGIVGELYAWVSLFIVLLTYGMETAFFRFSQIDNYRRTVYSTATLSLFTTSLLFIILTSYFAQPIANWLQYPDHPNYVIWLSIIIGVDALTSIFFAGLRLQMRPFRFAFVKITNIAVNVLLNLFFLLLCPYLLRENIAVDIISRIYDPAIGVGYIFLANLAASIVTLLLLLPELFKSRIRFNFALWKKMMVYAFPLLILSLAGIVNETMDRVLLKRLSPQDIAQAQVGIYSACYKISIMMTIFIQAFKYAAEPYFFTKSKDKDAKQAYSDVMSVFVIVCMVIFLGVMLFMDVVKNFVGPKYHEGLGVVPILLLANLFLGIFYNLSIWYKLTDQTRFGAYISLLGAGITLLLNYLLIPLIGYMGSAWATFICYFVMMALSYLLGHKYYRVDYKVTRICLYIIFGVGIYMLTTLIHIPSFALKMIVHAVLLLAYVLIVFIADKKYLTTIFKR